MLAVAIIEAKITVEPNLQMTFGCTRFVYNYYLAKRKEVYEKFKNRITFDSFASIWDGTTWKDIKPEVYTEENKLYYMKHATDGSKSEMAKFTTDEVLQMRERYVNEDARSIYKDYQDRCSYQTLQQILWGRTYKDLPVYKKKQRVWVNK